MTDRESLDMAAKAAGHKLWFDEARRPHVLSGNPYANMFTAPVWDPRNDDGDSFRLAVKLKLEIYIDHRGVSVRTHCGIKTMESGDDCKAVRLAIFRAAIEIGKGL